MPVIVKSDEGKPPEQYPKDEILNEDNRMVRGWLSVEVPDKTDEVIPIAELRKTLNTWMMRGGVITDSHSNRVIGKATRWYEAVHPKSEKPGIIIDYQIYSDYSADDEVWENIKSGKRKGLSFGGRAMGDPEFKNAPTGDGSKTMPAKFLKGVEAYEVASVDEPCHQDAENIAVNFLAKSAPVEKEEVMKPFAGYKDFKDCVAQNKDKKDANAYCATIQRETEKAIKKEDEGMEILNTFLNKETESNDGSNMEKAKVSLDEIWTGAKKENELALGAISEFKSRAKTEGYSDSESNTYLKRNLNKELVFKENETENTEKGDSMVDKIKAEEEDKKPVEAKPEEEEKKKQETDEEEEDKKKEFPVQDNGMGKMVALLEAIASKLGVGEGGVPSGEPVADIAQKGGVVDEQEKLPKTPEDNASISQTSDATEETDKVPAMEKSIEKVMKDVLKSYGITKSQTPRPATAPQAPVEVKKKAEDKQLSGLDILKSARDGKSVGWSDIHSEVRKSERKNMEAIFGQKE